MILANQMRRYDLCVCGSPKMRIAHQCRQCYVSQGQLAAARALDAFWCQTIRNAADSEAAA